LVVVVWSFERERNMTGGCCWANGRAAPPTPSPLPRPTKKKKQKTKKPKNQSDMPVGVVGCISFVTVIYVIMALVLVMMVPYNTLDEAAAFAVAFEQTGFVWGRYLVALGAVLGTITGVMVGMMGVARLVCCLCRSHIGPPIFGRVNAKRGTPAWATVLTTLFVAPFALLTDLPALIDMCSAAALAAFAVVAIAHLFKRWMPRKARAGVGLATEGMMMAAEGAAAASPVAGARCASAAVGASSNNADAALAKALEKEDDDKNADKDDPWARDPSATGLRNASVASAFGVAGTPAAAAGSHQGKRAGCVIAAIVALAAGFGIAWGLTENADGLGWISIVILAAATFGVATYGHFTLKKLDTCVFEAPCFPFLPVTSLLFNCFLMASLSGKAYVSFDAF
jgi:amino acid transporter